MMLLFRSGNESHECENATSDNARFLQENPAVRFYYGFVVCLTSSNFLLNLLCFLVFRSMRPRRQFNRLLMLLSAIEAIFQAVFACNHALVFSMDTNQLTLPTLGAAYVVSVTLMLSLGLLTAAHLLRNWCVVLISYYRWMVVSQSLPTALPSGNTDTGAEVNDRCSLWPTSKRRIRQCLGFAVLISLLVSAPRLFEFQVIVCSTNHQVTHIDGLLGRLAAYRIAYLGVVLCIFQNVGPIICLLVFSIFLVRFLVRQSRRRMSMNLEPCERFRSRNRTVLLLCALFLICECPTLLKSIDPMNQRWQSIGFTANFLTCLNSSLNILVYNCAHEKFNDGLARLLSNRRRGYSSNHGAASGGGRSSSVLAGSAADWLARRRLGVGGGGSSSHGRSYQRRCSSVASIDYRRRYDGRLRSELETTRSFCTTTIGGGLEDNDEEGIVTKSGNPQSKEAAMQLQLQDRSVQNSSSLLDMQAAEITFELQDKAAASKSGSQSHGNTARL